MKEILSHHLLPEDFHTGQENLEPALFLVNRKSSRFYKTFCVSLATLLRITQSECSRNTHIELNHLGLSLLSYILETKQI